MANGMGQRWQNHLGIPKHLYRVGGESLVARIVRQLGEAAPGDEVVISSSDPRLDVPGVRRHEPLHNQIELDRFVDELITDKVCFLYGDTFYTDRALRQIVEDDPAALTFFATEKSIVAVKSGDPVVLRHHLHDVREKFLAGQLPTCKGWQLLDSYQASLDAGDDPVIAVEDRTMDFNTPQDADHFERQRA